MVHWILNGWGFFISEIAKFDGFGACFKGYTEDDWALLSMLEYQLLLKI